MYFSCIIYIEYGIIDKRLEMRMIALLHMQIQRGYNYKRSTEVISEDLIFIINTVKKYKDCHPEEKIADIFKLSTTSSSGVVFFGELPSLNEKRKV